MAPRADDAGKVASSSAWSWVPEYGLYYSAARKQYAKPLPSGEWDYADAQATSDGRKQVSYEDVDEGDGGVEFDERGKGKQAARAVPEEQLWPDDEVEDLPPLDPYAKAPILRLVVLKRPEPSVLPTAQTVASLDPSEPVTVGRDKSFERRIRLKELAVSKTHCTLYWDIDPLLEDGGFWAVADNGSMHGTFVSSEGVGKMRLSEPKVASAPSRLRHLDSLHVGSTTFSVHIHASFACSACSVTSDSSNVIPLVPPAEERSTAPSKYATKTKEEKEQDRRDQLRGLRAKLLQPETTKNPKPSTSSSAAKTTSPSSPSAATPKSVFVDRAAARRHRDGAPSRAPAPAKPAPMNPFFAIPGPAASFSAPPSQTPASSLDSFSSESKGAQLLSKLTRPSPASSATSPTAATSVTGAASRPSGTGLGTLIQPRTFDPTAPGARDARPGLGSGRLVEIEKVSQKPNGKGGVGGGAAGEKRNWREDVREASRKRYREMG
ncbi:hypothetical protein JCM11641_008126 [Rhodosporidiobolus odoratus]